MGARRLAACILFGLAAGCAFGWWFEATTTTDIGLLAAGLFFFVLSGFAPSFPAVTLER